MHRHSDSISPTILILLTTAAAAMGFGMGALCTARTGADNRAALKKRIGSIGSRTALSKNEIVGKVSEMKDVIEDSIPEVSSDDSESIKHPEKDPPER